MQHGRFYFVSSKIIIRHQQESLETTSGKDMTSDSHDIRQKDDLRVKFAVQWTPFTAQIRVRLRLFTWCMRAVERNLVGIYTSLIFAMHNEILFNGTNKVIKISIKYVG